jgi:hypothetical protein
MTWGLAYWYIRRADRVFDALAERAARRALEVAEGDSTRGAVRRDEAATVTPTEPGRLS